MSLKHRTLAIGTILTGLVGIAGISKCQRTIGIAENADKEDALLLSQIYEVKEQIRRQAIAEVTLIPLTAENEAKRWAKYGEYEDEIDKCSEVFMKCYSDYKKIRQLSVSTHHTLDEKIREQCENFERLTDGKKFTSSECSNKGAYLKEALFEESAMKQEDCFQKKLTCLLQVTPNKTK